MTHLTDADIGGSVTPIRGHQPVHEHHGHPSGQDHDEHGHTVPDDDPAPTPPS